MSKIGVVIPAYNEEKVIGETLQSLLAAGFPPQAIIVINDCSRDKTEDIAKSLGVKVRNNASNIGKILGVKMALEDGDLSGYEWVAFMDADTVVEKNFLAETLKAIELNSESALIIGQVKSRKHNWLTAYRAAEYKFTHDLYKSAQSKIGAIIVAPGCASVYRYSILKKLNFDNDTLVEDMDLTVQIHRKGLGKIIYAPNVAVYTQDPLCLKDYWRQISRWYTGCWQIIRKYNIPFGMRTIDFEFFLLYGEGLIYPFVLLISLIAKPSVALFIFSADLAVNFAVSVYASARLKRLDVLYWFPAYFFVRYLNVLCFLASGLKVFAGKKSFQWNKVKRY